MLDDIFLKLAPHSKKVFLLLITLAFLDVVLWAGIVFASTDHLKIHFLSVGQGDSELIIFPGGAKLLIDGGPPNGRALEEIGKALGPTDRSIDLVLLTHPQLDHFGGLIEIMKHYRVGAFLWNGEQGSAGAFQDLTRAIQEKHIASYILKKGDLIHYGENVADIVWPPEGYAWKDPNDDMEVLALKSDGIEALFTGDLGAIPEDQFLSTFHDLVDILKVGHHGSKYATSQAFLNVLQPKVAVIEVGKNTYGHPASTTLERLRNIGARIFRTDKNGTVTVEVEGGKLKLATSLSSN